jgi:hypothetical protein
MAIAFDTFTDGSIVNPGTALNWNHTCTGSNLYLIVGTIGDLTSDLITGVTYNTVAMTKLNVVQTPSDRYVTLWGLAGPASGTHQVSVSASSSIVIEGGSASYTGVSGLDASATTNAAASPATSVTGTITTIAANAWTVAIFRNDNAAASAGTGTTSRGNFGDLSCALMDSNGALSPGSHTLQATLGGGENWAVVIASLAPSGASVSDGPRLSVNTPALAVGTPVSHLRSPIKEVSHIGSLAALGLSVTMGVCNLVGLSAPSSDPVQSPGLALGTPKAHLRAVQATDNIGRLSALGLSVTTGSCNLVGLSEPSGTPTESPGIGLGTPRSRLRAYGATDQTSSVTQFSTLGLSATTGAANLTDAGNPSSLPVKSPGLGLGTPKSRLKGVQATDQQGQIAVRGLSSTIGSADLQGTAAQSPSGPTGFNSPELDLGSPLAKLRARYATDQLGQLNALGLSESTGSADLQGSGALSALGLSSTTGSADLKGSGALSALGLSETTGSADLQGSGAVTALGLSATTGSADLQQLNPGAFSALGLSASLGQVELTYTFAPPVSGQGVGGSGGGGKIRLKGEKRRQPHEIADLTRAAIAERKAKKAAPIIEPTVIEQPQISKRPDDDDDEEAIFLLLS